MKKILSIIAAFALSLSCSFAQVKLGGHVYVPSSSDSNGGLTYLSYDAQGTCNVLAVSTICDLGGSTPDKPYNGTIIVNDNIGLGGITQLWLPGSLGRSYYVQNTTSVEIDVYSIASSGVGPHVAIQPGFSSNVFSDGANYYTFGLTTVTFPICEQFPAAPNATTNCISADSTGVQLTSSYPLSLTTTLKINGSYAPNKNSIEVDNPFWLNNPSTVALLPVCSVSTVGFVDRASNLTSTQNGVVAVGGGTIVAPVVCMYTGSVYQWVVFGGLNLPNSTSVPTIAATAGFSAVGGVCVLDSGHDHAFSVKCTNGTSTFGSSAQTPLWTATYGGVYSTPLYCTTQIRAGATFLYITGNTAPSLTTDTMSFVDTMPASEVNYWTVSCGQ